MPAAQAVEHYEMASYGCARTWAEQLGLEEAAGLLEETFKEEKEALLGAGEMVTVRSNQAKRSPQGSYAFQNRGNSHEHGIGRAGGW